MLLKPLQDADVCESQRAAAFQRHADFGSRPRRGFRLGDNGTARSLLGGWARVVLLLCSQAKRRQKQH